MKLVNKLHELFDVLILAQMMDKTGFESSTNGKVEIHACLLVIRSLLWH